MDRNGIIGTVLLGILLLGFLYNQSGQLADEVEQREKVVADSLAKASEERSTQLIEENSAQLTDATIEDTPDSNEQVNALKGRYGQFYASAEGEEQEYVIENDKMIITISSKGGMIKNVQLKEFLKHDKTALNLFNDSINNFAYSFPLSNAQVVQSTDFNYSANKAGFKVTSKEVQSISLKLQAGPNKYIEHRYTLSGDDYLVDFQTNFVGINDVVASNVRSFDLLWSQKVARQEKGINTERQHSTLVYKYNHEDDVEDLGSRDKENEETLSSGATWISFKQQFFNQTLISKSGNLKGKVELFYTEEDTSYVKAYTAQLKMPVNNLVNGSNDYQFYFGPNHYQTLKAHGMSMQKLINFSNGFSMLAWVGIIAKYLIIPIFNTLEKFISSYGIIILLLTLVIKTILLPLVYKSYKSSAAMKVLKPELDALREKIGDNQQKMAQEQMKLYSSAGVNPLGGCIPMLLQMPILFSMFYFFPTSIELRQESFLWASDLSTFDTIYTLPFSIPFYGSNVSLFTILMGVSSMLVALSNPQMSSNQPGAQMIKYMPYIMPFFLIFFFNSWQAPAALTYYYFLSNIITFLQQFIIRNFVISDEKILAKIKENKKKPPKKSGFAKRLEEAYKMQQQQQAQKNKGKKK